LGQGQVTKVEAREGGSESGAITVRMDSLLEEPPRCPACGTADRLMRASDAVAEVSEYAAPEHALDPQIPSYLVWSVYQYVAIACALFAVTSIGAGRIFIPTLLDYVMTSGVVLVPIAGVLAVRNTRRNMALVRQLAPEVRAVHAHAVYCGGCESVYFDSKELPSGLTPYAPMPANGYRRRLWMACGYTRMH
jgi:hypothetical protein